MAKAKAKKVEKEDPETALGRIIHDALNEAAQVKCSAGVYRENLHYWREEIAMAIKASEETSDDEDEEDDDEEKE